MISFIRNFWALVVVVAAFSGQATARDLSKTKGCLKLSIALENVTFGTQWRMENICPDKKIKYEATCDKANESGRKASQKSVLFESTNKGGSHQEIGCPFGTDVTVHSSTYDSKQTDAQTTKMSTLSSANNKTAAKTPSTGDVQKQNLNTKKDGASSGNRQDSNKINRSTEHKQIDGKKPTSKSPTITAASYLGYWKDDVYLDGPGSFTNDFEFVNDGVAIIWRRHGDGTRPMSSRESWRYSEGVFNFQKFSGELCTLKITVPEQRGQITCSYKGETDVSNVTKGR